MTDSEIYNTFIYPMLSEYATVYGTGNITPSSGAGYLQPIGMVADYYTINEVGTHPVFSVDTFSFDMIYTRYDYTSENFTRPLTWNNGAIREMNDSEIYQYIVDPAIQYIANGGLGSYYMTSSPSSAPTHVSNATWSLRYNSFDQLTSGTASASNAIAIWQLSGLPSPGAASYPLKPGSASILEYTGSMITAMSARMRNRMIQTGVGLYYISPGTPGGGVWATAGSYQDTRRNDAVLNYSGTYTGSYTGAYAGDYTGEYILWYGGSVGAYYSGTYTGYYSGTYTGNYTGYYDGRTILNSNVNSGPVYYLWTRRS
jgi:hypothetical protein